MSEAKVESMMTYLCFNGLDLNYLSYGIQDLLNDPVITQIDPALTADDTAEVYGSPQNIVLLRRIRDAVMQNPWNQQTITALNPVVENAQGPLFFRLIKIMYQNWSRQRDEFNARSSSDESSGSVSGSDGSDSSHDDDRIDTHEFVRRTGRRRLGASGQDAQVTALLQQLQQMNSDELI